MVAGAGETQLMVEASEWGRPMQSREVFGAGDTRQRNVDAEWLSRVPYLVELLLSTMATWNTPEVVLKSFIHLNRRIRAR